MVSELPAPAPHAGIMARLSIPIGVALLSAFFKDAAPALAMIPPVALAALEMRDSRAKAILEERLRSGCIVDLDDEQVAAFVPMGIRFMAAARQGEYDHNLRLLASYLAAELREEAPHPGAFLDMSRRLEGMSRVTLHAAACIGFWVKAKTAEGVGPRQVNITAELLANEAEMPAPMEWFDAAGALADLMGRGFLFQRDGGLGPGGFYKLTQAMLDLLEKATALGAV